MPAKPHAFSHLDDALTALAARLSVVGIESVSPHTTGRVLAENVVADRDSPAADVSAMDGYAVRLSQLRSSEPLAVRGESIPGAPPLRLDPKSVVRIFTGGVIPEGAEAVIKREETEEFEDSIRLLPSARSIQEGENIRRAGENARAHSPVLAPGIVIRSPQQATMENFGCVGIAVHARVRVAILTTGDEVGSFTDSEPAPWQLRNSNRAALLSMLSPVPWLEVVAVDHARDDRDELRQRLAAHLQDSDAVLLTGGVSIGDHDHVPEVVRDVGGKIVFHGLPMRPGKPILGAATGDGRLVLGLPGNPVSATIGCRRMAIPLLAKLSGQRDWLPRVGSVNLASPGDKTLPMYWLRLARWVGPGCVECIPSLGSGDLVSLGRSDGFVECMPHAGGSGPFPFYPWAIG